MAANVEKRRKCIPTRCANRSTSTSLLIGVNRGVANYGPGHHSPSKRLLPEINNPERRDTLIHYRAQVGTPDNQNGYTGSRPEGVDNMCDEALETGK